MILSIRHWLGASQKWRIQWMCSDIPFQTLIQKRCTGLKDLNQQNMGNQDDFPSSFEIFIPKGCTPLKHLDLIVLKSSFSEYVYKSVRHG